MPLTAELAAQQVQDRLKAMQALIHDLEAHRRRSEPKVSNIIKAHEKFSSEDKPGISQHEMKTLYKMGIQDAIEEEAIIRQALSKIQEIRQIRNERWIQARNAGNKETIRRETMMKMVQISGQTLPLFVSKPGEKVPPLCGAIPAEPNYIAKPGHTVAAFAKNAENEINWILAEVVQFLSGQNKYEVDDIDEEQKDRHVLSKRKIIPLPLMKANPETDGHALFPKDTMVLALYPQTTCFYKAIITRLPETATDQYEVIFEDSSYPNGYSTPCCVPQRYVITYKSIKKCGSLSSA